MNTLGTPLLGSRRLPCLRALAGSLGGGLVALTLWGGAPVIALAGDHGDHELARQAVESGQILPLREVLDRLERSYPGKVLAVELERDDGIWIYEIKLLQANGGLLKLKLNAKTADMLKVKPKPKP